MLLRKYIQYVDKQYHPEHTPYQKTYGNMLNRMTSTMRARASFPINQSTFTLIFDLWAYMKGCSVKCMEKCVYAEDNPNPNPNKATEVKVDT